MKMKIAINCRVLNKRHWWPKKYTLDFLKELINTDKHNTYVLCFDKKYNFEFKIPSNFQEKVLNQTNKFLYEYLSLPKYINKNEFDFYVSFEWTFAPYIKPKKITFINDLIYFEKWFKREYKFFDHIHHKIMLRLFLRLSYKVFAISEFTKSRASYFFWINNINVFHLWINNIEIDETKLDDILNKYWIKKPYICFIGSLSPRKNIERLILAFNNIKSKIPHNLYLVWGYSWNDNVVKKLINKSDKIFKLGFVEEKDLPYIYLWASILTYLSLYEWFWMPILEANTYYCPVLTSSSSSCPEIAWEWAYIINPYIQKEIEDGILNIIGNKILSEDLKYKWKENSKRFTANESVTKFINTINNG